MTDIHIHTKLPDTFKHTFVKIIQIHKYLYQYICKYMFVYNIVISVMHQDACTCMYE